MSNTRETRAIAKRDLKSVMRTAASRVVPEYLNALTELRKLQDGELLSYRAPEAQSRMAEVSKTRETRAIAQIPCPRCKAPVGEPCRTHHRDGNARMVPMHGPACCRERRLANQKRLKGALVECAA